MSGILARRRARSRMGTSKPAAVSRGAMSWAVWRMRSIRVGGRLENFVNNQRHFLADIAHEVRSPLGRPATGPRHSGRAPADFGVADVQRRVRGSAGHGASSSTSCSRSHAPVSATRTCLRWRCRSRVWWSKRWIERAPATRCSSMCRSRFRCGSTRRLLVRAISNLDSQRPALRRHDGRPHRGCRVARSANSSRSR